MPYKRVPIVTIPGHPLARAQNHVRVSRLVLWEKNNGIAAPCHWCGCDLTWRTLCADHLDSDTENNSPENLVPSCRGCNANREDGTGYGRRVPLTCERCGVAFVNENSTREGRRFCSRACWYQHRQANPPLHGSRSRYSNHGCRCNECRAAHTAYMAVYSQRQSLPHGEAL